ncbi:MAG: uroporphyrinogen-III C-methyltransferase [Burkholderiales bacterium]|nr:uroporphyrinogen-III C-methyltransferase [Burkholderiales bacterium]
MPAPAAAPAPAPAAAASQAPLSPAPSPPPARVPARVPVWAVAGLVAALLAAAAALWQAQATHQRLRTLEAELVRRQQDSSSQATEARTLAREAENTVRAADARLALLEARVAESSMQRSQLEELIQSMARSRDENVLADIEASIRVAVQQTAITGSADPLVLTLKQADERLARYNQPRLERVRRAIAQDLERTRNAGVTDVTALTIRLDEVVREIDDLPLLSAPLDRAATGPRAAPAATARPASAAGPVGASRAWAARLESGWREVAAHLWQEARGLLRVTRIADPDAMLIAPEQAYFLRENLKLRLLNARLELLSRQFDAAQADLRDADTALGRYFDRRSRRVAQAGELLRQVAAQARLVTVPRPSATLAAIAAITGGR